MASVTTTLTTFTDDLDGSDATGTTTFGYDGVTYEIDLSHANQELLSDALAPFLQAAREVAAPAGSVAKPRGKGRARSPKEVAAIREWAAQNGHEINPKGRIPADIVREYLASKQA